MMAISQQVQKCAAEEREEFAPRIRLCLPLLCHRVQLLLAHRKKSEAKAAMGFKINNALRLSFFERLVSLTTASFTRRRRSWS
jgi:hypothetical protein